jgi:hypothetical protein
VSQQREQGLLNHVIDLGSVGAQLVTPTDDRCVVPSKELVPGCSVASGRPLGER